MRVDKFIFVTDFYLSTCQALVYIIIIIQSDDILKTILPNFVLIIYTYFNDFLIFSLDNNKSKFIVH